MKVLGHITPEYAQILTVGALAFLAKLHRNFTPAVSSSWSARALRQKELDSGKLPIFLPETKHVREADWQVAPVPAGSPGSTGRDLRANRPQDGDQRAQFRRQHVHGDFEDSSTPTWDNQLQGQINVRDALTRSISFTSPEGRRYRLADKPPLCWLRPRGWHLCEKHVVVDGQPMSGSLFDFGPVLLPQRQGTDRESSGVYLYLRKWNRISRRDCGTTPSSSRRRNSVFNKAR